MAKVELTVKQIINLGLWEKVCDYRGWNTWILNEGKMDENETVEFDDEFKKEVKTTESNKFTITCPKCSSNNSYISTSIYDSYVVGCNDCGFKESDY